ncbi:MAG: DUF116 domain-containing protein [Desulfovibrio sp.]|nr:DUF116 domain-containing protein [Desulfovibrio sp.]
MAMSCRADALRDMRPGGKNGASGRDPERPGDVRAGHSPPAAPVRQEQRQKNEARSLAFMSAAPPRRPRKRLFIGLVTGTSVLLCLVLLTGWIIPVVGLGNIHPYVPWVTGFLLFSCIAVIAFSSLSLVLQIAFGRNFRGSSTVRGVTAKLFLPLMELLARPFGLSAEDVRRSFIRVNNDLTLKQCGVFAPERILILLPHCLQKEDCPRRLGLDADRCGRCGLCPVAGLLALRDAYGVRLAMASGGSIARRIVVETRPALIIAVACERDLTSGICDTHPVPVFGILNARPAGPCRNTMISHEILESALRRFIDPARCPVPFVPSELRTAS